MTHKSTFPQGPDPALLRLLPHRPPFLLLDRLETPQTSPARAFLTLRGDNPFLNKDGILEAVAYAEIMAQCFAAAGADGTEGIDGTEGDAGDGKTGNTGVAGYLAALRDVRVFDLARLGDCLEVTVHVAASLGPVTVVEGEVWRGQTLLAKGQCKIFVTEARP